MINEFDVYDEIHEINIEDIQDNYKKDYNENNFQK